MGPNGSIEFRLYPDGKPKTLFERLFGWLKKDGE